MARNGDQQGPKFGAVLLKEGQELSVGWNHKFLSTETKMMNKKVMHAEVHCLVQLPDPEVARGCQMWIVQTDEHGAGYGSGYPCPACSQALCKFGIAEVYYSDADGVGYLGMRHHKAEMQSPTYALAKAEQALQGAS